ncbi:hypothetical protein MMC07_002992 [Pseudocyphellaria aurata]|nr:hypothetical protein [Pseudocyphellaria aurata]
MGLIQTRDMSVHNRGAVLVVVSIVFNSVAFALVALRLGTRIVGKRTLGMDDYAIFLSLIFSIGLTIANCISVDHGYGKMLASLSPEDVHIALEGFWAIQIIYKFTINLTKTSILLLYLRIFPNKSFRKAVYGLLVFVNGYAVASIIATIFQCTPVVRAFDHGSPGSCIDLTAFWYANASANILGDFAILALPMPVINSLHLPRRQRIGLMMVFALGGFVCVTSILRMTTLEAGSKAKDQLHGTLVSTVWTTIEANTGIICACLPMLKTPLSKIFPRILLRSTHDDSARRGGTIRHSKASPMDFDSWGRPGSGKPAVTHSATIASPTRGHRSSDEQIFGVDAITKTTDIQVEFGPERASGSRSTNDQDSMTISHGMNAAPHPFLGHGFS